jgi:ribosome assembly protein RRB1
MGKNSKRVRAGKRRTGVGSASPAAAASPPQREAVPSSAPRASSLGGAAAASVDDEGDRRNNPSRQQNRRRRREDDDDAAATNPRRRESEEETKENLQFEDPFPDETDDNDDDEWSDVVAEEEEDDDLDKLDVDPIEEDQAGGVEEVVKAWNPFSLDAAGGKQGGRSAASSAPAVQLEMDPSAYKLHHALTAEWPSLSFDFVRDGLGSRSSTRFPHSLLCAAGTQADRPADNRVTVMKLSDLGRIRVETEDDILGEEYDPQAEDDEDGSDEEGDDDDDADLDPIVEHYSIKHYGGVNRIRSMPQRPNIVATWSDAGRVNLFDVDPILQRFSASVGEKWSSSAAAGGPSPSAPARFDNIPTKPYFSYAKHGTEGYAMDWSPHASGGLVTGDCHGGIHVWNPRTDGSYAVSKAYGTNPSNSNSNNDVEGMLSAPSVEDVQWSPSEATVLASAECGGHVRIYDTRAPNRAMISHKIHANGSDVNVLSWNALVTNLLATGSDDGVLSVWDLRHFAASQAESTHKGPKPLARFTPHATPITSVEWHPTDESMLAATDDRGAYVYDLSVEEDDVMGDASDAIAGDAQSPSLPPQLLFVHCGSEQFKEVHWHPQISSLLMTTALSGYSVFIPSNL